MKTSRIFLAAVIFISIGTGRIYAEENVKNEAAFKSRSVAASDVDAQSGNIAVQEVEFKYDLKTKAFEKLPVEFSIKINHRGIDDEVPELLPTRLESRQLGLGTKFPAPFIADEHYFVGVDIFPTLNTDDWTLKGGAFRMPVRAYLIYKRSEEFILIGGLTVRPSYDSTVLPVIGLIYKPNDHLSFNLASDSPNISYKLTEKTTLLWEFNYALEEYEVTRGGQDGVVLKYNELSTGAGLEHAFTQYMKAALGVGAVFARRIEFKNEDYGKVVPDAGVYVQARLTADF